MSTLGLALIVILVFLLLGSFPQLGLHQYGYYPTGGIGLLLLVIIILAILGRV